MKLILLIFSLHLTCTGLVQAAEKRWFKGNTHTHSLWSDGNGFPDMIAGWYKAQDYHFLVLSDHNVLSRGERWMKVKDVERRRRTLGHSSLKKYLGTMGEDWVELRGEGDAQEVRLKTLAEVRGKFEEPERFLMIEGEEVTDGFGGKPVHTNAINVSELIKPPHGDSLRATMRNAVLAAQEQSERTGRHVLTHLDHPNFGWAITAEDIAHVGEHHFFEVYNGHPGVKHLGDAKRPGVERMWDMVNTLRLAKLDGELLYGIATDDSHHYHGGDVMPGRGWIMVHAEKLDAESIVNGLLGVDFYSSSGVTLKDISFDPKMRQLQLEIEPLEGETYSTQFIGTRRGSEDDPEQIGVVLATVEGVRAQYKMKGDEWFVRATVTSSAAHPRPSFKDQKKQAWAQPVPGPARLADLPTK